MSERERGGSEDASWQTHKAAFESKQQSKYYDPCQEAANRSIKCMNRNGGKREFCSDYFVAYKECKKAWMTARNLEKWQASSPQLLGSKDEKEQAPEK